MSTQIEATFDFDADPGAIFRCAQCGALPSEHATRDVYGLESSDGRRYLLASRACLQAFVTARMVGAPPQEGAPG